MRKTYTTHYESYKNCFLVVFVNIKDTNEIIKFEVSEQKNDFVPYINFMRDLINNHYTVSFNGINYGMQIAIYCINQRKSLSQQTSADISHEIFAFTTVLRRKIEANGYPPYPVDKMPFKEIDLASLNNYNGKQKSSSLKWIQYNMNWNNMMQMDIERDKKLTNRDIHKLTILSINDCLSICKLLSKNRELIQARQDLSEHFGLNLYSLSEPKLVKAILIDLLSKDMGISKTMLRKMQTHRGYFQLGEVILPYIKFTTESLKKTLEKFMSLTLNGENLKGTFKHQTSYRGMTFSFALGGIHGAKRGLYKTTKDMMIKSFDAKSFYPLLCIKNGWSPKHIPKEIFIPRYTWFFTEREKYPKTNPLNYLFKIILNAGVGSSNDKHSFLKDSLLTMRVNCNGQLLLVQLMEELCESIPGARPIMVNTDGGEIIFPKEYEPLYDTICKKWEKMTDLILEYELYEKLIIWDVNNYIGIFEPEEVTEDQANEMFATYPKPLIKKVDNIFFHYPVKLKGRFEIDKDLHKNKSFRIKAIAIYNYFVHGVQPEKTLRACKNIYDFCAGIRAKGDWKVIPTDAEGEDVYNPNTQKTIRYYVSRKGCKLVKEQRELVTEPFEVEDSKGRVTKSYKKGDTIVKQIKVEASKVLERVAIRVDPKKKIEDYDIDYDFYLRIIKREIESVDHQL